MLGASGIVWHSLLLCADRVEEVGVFAETVAILLNVIEDSSLIIKVSIPLVCAVVGFSCLQTAKDVFIIISNSGDLLDSNCAVQRVVGNEAVGV